ncbi:esterase [Nocardioides sp. YIM 152588]|uniref:alpha/beta hydrolase n=1 Tax=Nocardioides sp. YIM 152588 TaxID=3158259 RepID=UPI0032E4466E
MGDPEAGAVEEQRRRGVTRRRLLLGTGAALGLGAAGLVAVDREVLPGRSLLYRTLQHDGTDGVVPDVTPGPSVTGSFASAARGTTVGWTIARPPGAPRRLPVVVVLHGRGGTHATPFRAGHLALDRFLAAAVADGVPPFALASVDGGDAYWHDRADGDRCEAMVLEEFLPLLDEQGLDIRRIGFFGWSMGGFGSLHLTHVLGADRVAGVAVMSPALFRAYADTTPGSYDGAADFDRVTVMRQQATFADIPLRVDCGVSDPFYAADREYVAGFADPPAGGFEPGGHTVGYWRRIAPYALEHLGRALA